MILVTGYHRILTITVWDQFDPPLPIGDVYQGAEVTEELDGQFRKINQSISASGTYADYVGQMIPKNNQIVFVSSSDPSVAAWLAQTPPPLSQGFLTYNTFM